MYPLLFDSIVIFTTGTYLNPLHIMSAPNTTGSPKLLFLFLID